MKKLILWMFIFVIAYAFQFNDLCDEENCDPLALIRAEIGSNSDDPDVRYKSIIDGYVAIADVPSLVEIVADSEKDPLQKSIDNIDPNESGEYFEEYCDKSTFQKILPLLRHSNIKLQKGILLVVLYTSKSNEQVNLLLDCNILEYLKYLLKQKNHILQTFKILSNILEFEKQKSDLIIESQIIKDVLPFLGDSDKEISMAAFGVSTALLKFYSLEARCEIYFKIIPILYKCIYEDKLDAGIAYEMFRLMTALSTNDIEVSTPWACKMLAEDYREEKLIQFFMKFLETHKPYELFNLLTNIFKITEKPLQKLNDHQILKLTFDTIHTNEEGPIIAGLKFLEYLLKREKKVIASAEILQSLNSLLTTKNENIQMHALNYIIEMGNFVDQHIPILMQQNLLSHLNQFFETSHQKQLLLPKAMKVLAQILKHKEYVSVVMEDGYFPKLINFLNHENEKIRHVSFWSISQIFLHRNKKASAALIEKGAILPFCNQIENKMLQEIILKGLYNLFYTDKTKRDNVCQEFQETQCLQKLQKLEKDEAEMTKTISAVIVSECRGDFKAMETNPNDNDDTKDSNFDKEL